MNRAVYYLVALVICADLGKELVDGDKWRAFGFVVALAALAAVRRELTKANR